MSDAIRSGLQSVRAGMTAAALRCGREPDSVALVAVSKTHPAEAIRTAWEAGQRVFGENYAQELSRKRRELKHLEGLEFHFIGGVQSNKLKYLVGNTSLIHSLDRPRTLEKLSSLAMDRGVVQPFLIEVHLSPEESKAGCRPAELEMLVSMGMELPGIVPRGLMTMPPYHLDADQTRPYFRDLRQLRDELFGMNGLTGFCELSMGMSHDYEAAIEEGATLVRVGSAIFGSRG